MSELILHFNSDAFALGAMQSSLFAISIACWFFGFRGLIQRLKV